ncbi:hypothetical protein SPURM210S_00775 [Streptomyces purpurascens]
MYVSMIQKSGRGSCGQSATPVAMSVSESRNSAPPSPAQRPSRVADPYAMAVSRRLYPATGTRRSAGRSGHSSATVVTSAVP